jgi:hypothetical protein
MDLESKKQKCSICGLYLSFSEFHKNKNKSSGIQSQCKNCMKIYKESENFCDNFVLDDTTNLFYIPNIFLVGVGRTQTYQHSCLKCDSPFFCFKSSRQKEDLFCENCDFSSFEISDLNKSHIDFLGHIVGWINKIECPIKKRSYKNYKKVYVRDEYTCQYCGYNLINSKEFKPLHIDHLKPWSAQGSNKLDNLVVACCDCNLIATDKWFNSFFEKKEYVIFERQRRAIYKQRQNSRNLHPRHYS